MKREEAEIKAKNELALLIKDSRTQLTNYRRKLTSNPHIQDFFNKAKEIKEQKNPIKVIFLEDLSERKDVSDAHLKKYYVSDLYSKYRQNDYSWYKSLSNGVRGLSFFCPASEVINLNFGDYSLPGLFNDEHLLAAFIIELYKHSFDGYVGAFIVQDYGTFKKYKDEYELGMALHSDFDNPSDFETQITDFLSNFQMIEYGRGAIHRPDFDSHCKKFEYHNFWGTVIGAFEIYDATKYELIMKNNIYGWFQSHYYKIIGASFELPLDEKEIQPPKPPPSWF